MIDPDVEAKQVDMLRQFKTTDGYKHIAQYARNEFIQCFRDFLFGKHDTLEKLFDLRSKAKSWYDVIESIDGRIEQFDQWLEGTVDQMKQQREQMTQFYKERAKNQSRGQL